MVLSGDRLFFPAGTGGIGSGSLGLVRDSNMATRD